MGVRRGELFAENRRTPTKATDLLRRAAQNEERRAVKLYLEIQDWVSGIKLQLNLRGLVRRYFYDEVDLSVRLRLIEEVDRPVDDVF